MNESRNTARKRLTFQDGVCPASQCMVTPRKAGNFRGSIWQLMNDRFRTPETVIQIIKYDDISGPSQGQMQNFSGSLVTATDSIQIFRDLDASSNWMSCCVPSSSSDMMSDGNLTLNSELSFQNHGDDQNSGYGISQVTDSNLTLFHYPFQSSSSGMIPGSNSRLLEQSSSESPSQNSGVQSSGNPSSWLARTYSSILAHLLMVAISEIVNAL